jgi:hypothetical protein
VVVDQLSAQLRAKEDQIRMTGAVARGCMPWRGSGDAGLSQRWQRRTLLPACCS